MSTFRIATPNDIPGIGRFIWLHFTKEELSEWTENIPACLSWYIKSSLCGIMEEGPTIKALVMGRPVATIEQGYSNRFATDWSGNILWVECVASDEGIKGAWREAILFLKFQGCLFDQVSWCRAKGMPGKRRVTVDFKTLNERLA